MAKDFHVDDTQKNHNNDNTLEIIFYLKKYFMNKMNGNKYKIKYVIYISPILLSE